jgi:hypothetical protein
MSAVTFFGLRGLRDPQSPAARMAEQFSLQNRDLLALLEARITTEYDGTEVRLHLISGNRVGAIPLISPASARADFGLVIKPRFPWAGIGPMMSAMGWRVSPQPMKLPLLKRSERRVPPWVLSSMILTRLAAMLKTLERRFELVQETHAAPRGRVDWTRYATGSLPRARFLEVPCVHPDLLDDRALKGAIRHTVELQRRSLETQRHHGSHVHRLLDLAEQIEQQVRMVPSYIPSPAVLETWQRRPLRAEAFINGLQAVEWTIEDRGLAGISDLAGVPWVLPMDSFFEAWVESIFTVVARRTGGRLKVGRKRETTHPLRWQPSYLGSQSSLQPDIWLEQENLTVIVDAKYKRHWEEFQERSWARMEEQIREHHRNDLLQVLAYANLARTERVAACLIYPCTVESWESLRLRSRLVHRAEITLGSRALELWLTAIPISADLEQVAGPLTEMVRRAATS